MHHVILWTLFFSTLHGHQVEVQGTKTIYDSPSSSVLIRSYRGGGSSDNEDINNDGTGATPTHRFWSTNSLHRLNEDIMAEAQSQYADKDEEGSIQEKTPFSQKMEQKRGRQYQQKQQKIDRAQNGRGGALTAVKTPTGRPSTSTIQNQNTNPLNGFFRWLAPPPTTTSETSTATMPNNDGKRKNADGGGRSSSTGSPKRSDRRARNGKPKQQQSSNKEHGSSDISPRDDKTLKASARPATTDQADYLAKLWWVNVWTQQLPDRPSEALERANTPDTMSRQQQQQQKDTASDQNIAPPDNETEVQELQDNTSKRSPTRNEPTQGDAYTSANDNEKRAVVVPEALAIEQKYENVKNISFLFRADSEEDQRPPNYVSTGAWAAIDGLTSLGLSRIHPAFRISRPLRPIRKVTARVTGLHGVLSGKPKMSIKSQVFQDETLAEEDLALVRRRIAAISKAREGVERLVKTDEAERRKKKGGWWGRSEPVDIAEVKQIATVATGMTDIPSIRKTPEELEEEKRRKERVQEIDMMISEAQKRLMQLACEKDELQRRPNPLWNYTTEKVSRKRGNQTTITTRRFSFPPDDLVEEYLDFLISTGRLVKLNHTDLWQNDPSLDDDDDDIIVDEFSDDEDLRKKQRGNGDSGGSWILRQSFGKGSTLGEKIGEAAEQAAYKSIAKAVMEVLARSISAIHGVNIMRHTDIRLSMEATPDLPPMSKQGIIPGGRNPNYARDALQSAMSRGAKKNRDRRYGYGFSEETFVQRDAVVETLLSHCQISAPLLKLFPLAWQRAMLGNIITLVTAVVADFCEGVQFEILGHRLSFSFKPITERDMIDHIAMAGTSFNRPRVRSDQFEAAVQATANDVSENLKFLDRWHERALGSGMLRAQIANLIARLVLTLAGEVLSGAQMDLWAAQAGGPRMVAGLEFRTTQNYMDPVI